MNKALEKLNITSNKTESLLDRITNGNFKFNNILQTVLTLVSKVSESIEKMIDADNTNELQKIYMTTLFKRNANAAESIFAKISQ